MKKLTLFYIFTVAALVLPLILFLQHVFAKEDGKVAYITFDDGPTLNTPSIVKTLDKYGAKATFFVLEERIVMYPDFIKQIMAGGNAIGLHGVSHSEAIYYEDDSPLREMEKTQKALLSLTGSTTPLVRVPFGSGHRLTKRQAQLLLDNGYIIWDWNVDPRDSVGSIVKERIMTNLKKGIKECEADPVILLHDRKSTALLLPYILEYMQEEGYTLLPISDKKTPVVQKFH